MIIGNAESLAITKQVTGDMSVNDLNFSKRVSSTLKRAGVKTLEQLFELSREELLRIRNMGTGSVDEIEAKLRKLYPDYVMRDKISLSDSNTSCKGKVIDEPEEILVFSARVSCALKRAGIKTIDQLVELSREDLMHISNMGECGVTEIEEKLKSIYPDYVMKDKRIVSAQKIYSAQESGNASVDLLVFSTRVSSALKRAGIKTIDQLVELSREELLRIRNMGTGSVDEIESKLKDVFPNYEMKKN